MGLFKKIGGAVKGLFGGSTGKTVAKETRRAGESQARAIMQGYRAQRQQIPEALKALTTQTIEAQEELRPFTQPGAAAMGRLESLTLAPGVDYTPAGYEAPTAEDVAASPAVRFRMQEAQRALETGAAARGRLFSGGHQRELARYMQGLASQEYEAEAQRRMREAEFAERQAQFAPQIDLQERAQQISALSGLTGQGLQAAGQLGGIRERFGQGMAGIRTGSGAAQAAAIQQAGQARASGALAGSQARQQAMGGLMGLTGTIGGAVLGGPIGAGIGRAIGGGVGTTMPTTVGAPTAMGGAGLGYTPSSLNLPYF